MRLPDKARPTCRLAAILLNTMVAGMAAATDYPPRQLDAFIRSELARWSRVARRSGAKAQ